MKTETTWHAISHWLSGLAVLLALAVPVPPVSAQLLLYDGMDYLGIHNGTQNGGDTAGGASFTSPWNPSPFTNNYEFVSGTLTYQNGEALDTSGNKSQGFGLRGSRYHDLGFTNGTVYLSFLINPTTTPTVFYAGCIINTPPPQPRVIVGMSQGTYMIAPWFDSNARVDSGVATAADRTDLLVVRIDLSSSGNDTISLYVNPTLPSTEPVTPDATTSDFDIVPTRVELVSSDGVFQFDEMRFGTTWDSVLPSGPVTGVDFTTATIEDVVGLTFQTASGEAYRLEYTMDPASTNGWTEAPIEVFGDGSELTVFDPAGFSTQKTYRIVTQ